MEQTLQTLGIQWPKLIAQTINFGIVLFVLWKWAYKPVLAMLELRRERVAETIKNAQQAREELQKTQAARQRILDEASAQANQLIEDARAAAARVQEQETQKAIAAAEQIIARAREAGEAEIARLKEELRREFGRLVVQAASRATGNILTPEQQHRLAEDAVRQLAA